MAVVTEESTQFENVFTDVPANLNDTVDWHGRMRIAFFDANNVTGGDATSSLAVIKLPPGKIRLVLPASSLYVNWTTASATMDIGWDAYTDLDGSAVAADPDGLADGIDVDVAGFFTGGVLAALAGLTATGGTKVFESKDGVTIRLTCQDVALAANDDVAGYFVYVQD